MGELSGVCVGWFMLGRLGDICCVCAFCVFVLGVFWHSKHVQCSEYSLSEVSVVHRRCTHLMHEPHLTDPPPARDAVTRELQIGQV